MIKLTTVCPNIATVLTLSVLLANVSFAQEAESILLPPMTDGANFESRLATPEVPDDLTSEDLNVLTRGPLHEAFASAHQPDPESSALILQTPPEPIDEVAPDYKPEGNDVQWISGYWAWDDAQSDFIWISGIWRDFPPKRKWMPGYWNAEGDGFRWVSGFWTEETQHEVGYLPQPPASLDQGPSTVAPSDEHFYVPGNWQFQDQSYRWLAGHWHPIVENWIWVPARYVWTPNGCVYQAGYWDYEFDNRGTCFAPVQFTQPLYLANNYRYRPTYAIDVNVDFMTHLFVRPRCGHYFYGDWYSSNFNNVSYRPWVSYNSHFRSYDPLLSYYRCRRSSFDSRYNVVQYLTRQHNFYTNNRDYRPRRTYSDQHKYANRIEHKHGKHGHGKDFIRKSNYVRSYKDLRKRDEQRQKQVTKSHHRTHKHRKVAETELRDNRRKADQLAELQRQRQRRERDVSNRFSKKTNGKIRMQNIPSTREREQARLRKAKDDARRTAERDQRNRQRRGNQSASRKLENERRVQDDIARGAQESTRRIKQREQAARKAQNDRSRQRAGQRAEQDRSRKIQQASERRVREDKARLAKESARRSQQREQSARVAQQDRSRQQAARRVQQDQARKTQQANERRIREDNARRAQESIRRAQQQQALRKNASRNSSGKSRMQNIPSIQEREQAARKAQQDRSRQQAAQRARQQQSQRDAARKAQQKSQQDQARRAKQAADRAKQDQARRAKQAADSRARQDRARRAQQKAEQDRSRQQAAQRAKQQQAQRDAARRAEQQARASRDRAAQESRSSRLRNRSSKSKSKKK